MLRTASQIRDVTDASLWVMDSRTQYFDEVRGLPKKSASDGVRG